MNKSEGLVPQTYTNDSQFVPAAPFLSDQALREVLDARPIVCVDVLFVDADERKVWLPTRTRKPAEGLWFIGGMLKRNETFEQAAGRFVERDAGLVFDVARLSFLAVNRFVWNYRQDQPAKNGRVDINFCYTYQITSAEANQASEGLDPGEYDAAAGLRALDRASLEQAIVAENGIKRVLLDYFDLHFGA